MMGINFMKLSVDVMGFENDINEAISACRDFIKQNHNVEIILVGDQQKIKPCLKPRDNFEIVHTNQFISQNDNILSIRNKKDSSMHKAIDLVCQKKADGVLSAGNSAIYVFLTYQKFGLMEGINKPGFMVYVPSFKGVGFNILDVGASKEVDAYDLYMFSLMANIYTPCRNVKNPRIGILNIGTEAHKGFSWHAEAEEMIKANKSLNYQGFVESKTILNGDIDVVVTDGYAGNICLKSLEGTSKSIFHHILSYYKNPLTFWLFPFVAPMLLKMKKKFDYKNNAGAFVLGLNNIAVKTHGSADYKQFYSSLRMLKESIDFNVLNKIKKEVLNESKRMKK